MSAARVSGVSRALNEPDRIGRAGRADAPAGGVSFPAALGSATQSIETPQTAMLARRRPVVGEQQDPPGQLPSAEQSAAMDDAVATSSADPARTSPAGHPASPTPALLDSVALGLDDIGATASADPARAPPASDAAGSSPAPADSFSLGSAGPALLDATVGPPDALETARPEEGSPRQARQAQIADRGSHRHRTPLSSHGIAELPNLSAAINAIPADAPPTDGSTDLASPSPISGDSNASDTVAPVSGGARPADLSSRWLRPAISADASAQSASGAFLAQHQAADPAEASRTTEAESPRGPASPRFSLSEARSSQDDPASDSLVRTLVNGIPPASGAELVSDQLRSLQTGKEFSHPANLGGPMVEAPSTFIGEAVSASVRDEGSAGSAISGFSPTELAGGLYSQLVRLIGNEGQEVVLRLHPPELGDLTVRVLVSGRDVSAWFASPQPQVQQAISQAIGQLHTDLGNAGYSLNGAWVGADAWSPGEQDGSSPRPQQQRGAANRSRIDGLPSLPTLSAASGVSVYV